jgi:dihydrofolate reductase
MNGGSGQTAILCSTTLLEEHAMQPLRYSVNVTLDGCYDHLAIIPDEEVHRHATESFDRADALVFGRVTYELMESAWRAPVQTGVRPDWMAPWMEPFARAIDAKKKYVVSGTLNQVDWNAELLRGELEESILQLKAQPGKGLFVAGVKLAQALTDLRLIDEYQFIVHPRIAGHGPTLFAGLSKPVDFQLVNRQEFSSGAAVLQYVPRN